MDITATPVIVAVDGSDLSQSAGGPAGADGAVDGIAAAGPGAVAPLSLGRHGSLCPPTRGLPRGRAACTPCT